MLPGFIDCHIHASQVPNLGLGLDKPLLEWLDSYTFPLESKYENETFAGQIYEKVVVTKRPIELCGQVNVQFLLYHRNERYILERQLPAILQPIMRIAHLY